MIISSKKELNLLVSDLKRYMNEANGFKVKFNTAHQIFSRLLGFNSQAHLISSLPIEFHYDQPLDYQKARDDGFIVPNFDDAYILTSRYPEPPFRAFFASKEYVYFDYFNDVLLKGPWNEIEPRYSTPYSIISDASYFNLVKSIEADELNNVHTFIKNNILTAEEWVDIMGLAFFYNGYQLSIDIFKKYHVPEESIFLGALFALRHRTTPEEESQIMEAMNFMDIGKKSLVAIRPKNRSKWLFQTIWANIDRLKYLRKYISKEDLEFVKSGFEQQLESHLHFSRGEITPDVRIVQKRVSKLIKMIK